MGISEHSIVVDVDVSTCQWSYPNASTIIEHKVIHGHAKRLDRRLLIDGHQM